MDLSPLYDTSPATSDCMQAFFSGHMFLRRTPAAPAESLSFIGAYCVLCRVCVLLNPKLTNTCPCEASTIFYYFILFYLPSRVELSSESNGSISFIRTSPATSDFVQAFFFFSARHFAPTPAASLSFIGAYCVLCRV